jgi:sRNA-binding carbon storage regulator CsrA
MLVLSRAIDEKVVITVRGRPELTLVIQLIDIRRDRADKARLGFEGPQDFVITRGEIVGTDRDVPRIREPQP